MSKMIQIRNVPDELHRTFKARAALQGKTLSDYLLEVMSKVGTKPSPEEVMKRIASRQPLRLKTSIVKALRDIREHS